MEAKKCPYCGRRLIIEHERYCQFCEQDISKFIKDEEFSPKIETKKISAMLKKLKTQVEDIKQKISSRKK